MLRDFEYGGLLYKASDDGEIWNMLGPDEKNHR